MTGRRADKCWSCIVNSWGGGGGAASERLGTLVQRTGPHYGIIMTPGLITAFLHSYHVIPEYKMRINHRPE